MDTLHPTDTFTHPLTDTPEDETPRNIPPEGQLETDKTDETPVPHNEDARVFGGRAIFAVGGRRISDYPWGAPDYR